MSCPTCYKMVCKQRNIPTFRHSTLNRILFSIYSVHVHIIPVIHPMFPKMFNNIYAETIPYLN